MQSFSLSSLKETWFGNVRNDLLAGMVVALALIPEAISFSIIAGVDPKVGLYASFCIAVVIAFAGGRSGMISAATGAMALVMVDLVKNNPLEYLFAATILTGVLQIIAGYLKLGTLMKFVSKSVMTGFVNALAILIFMAQLPEFLGEGFQTYGLIALGLAIIYLFPYVTKAIPSPLVCIFVLTGLSLYFGFDVKTVGDKGDLPETFPIFNLPKILMEWETYVIIFPYSVTLMAVGLLESLMTARIVDDLTDTESNKNRECKGQGLANIVAGCFGGMAGCAMIGQSVINVKSGGRGRLSTLFAGSFLLFLIVILGDYVAQIPMAALVAVMIMVSIGTFSWSSVMNARIYPKSSTIVMVVTVLVVVFTHDLAKGVFVGVLLSAVFFAWRVSGLSTVVAEYAKDGSEVRYIVKGQVFFASSERFEDSFNFKEVIPQVKIDVTQAHFWDLTAVAALDKVVLKFRREGTDVEIIGMNTASQTLVDRVAVYDKADAEQVVGH